LGQLARLSKPCAEAVTVKEKVRRLNNNAWLRVFVCFTAISDSVLRFKSLKVLPPVH
jgi:hypothetical protein